MSSKEPESVEEVIGELDELASKSDAVRIRDVLDDFGGRSFGPFLLLPALLEITPIGGIPGVPSFLAAIIALIAMQMLIGKDHVWLPGFVERRAIESKKLHKAVTKLRSSVLATAVGATHATQSTSSLANDLAPMRPRQYM